MNASQVQSVATRKFEMWIPVFNRVIFVALMMISMISSSYACVQAFQAVSIFTKSQAMQQNNQIFIYSAAHILHAVAGPTLLAGPVLAFPPG